MERRRVFVQLLLVLVLVSVLGLSSWAQLPTSTLNGIVTDPQGAAVPGARVVVTNKATGVSREVTTGDEGSYVFANLAPGVYDVRVEKSGFSPRDFKEVRLEVGRNVTLDVTLALGTLGQEVTVAGAASELETTQSQVQGLIGATTVENIPLNGRNFLELAFLIPGNRSATNFDPTKTNSLEVASAGQFGRGGNITVDGGDNNDEVVGGTLSNFPEDGIQEFQIATNRYTAEVGRSGSSIINIITKSGSNELHGSAFIFFRNRELQGLPATFDRSQCTSSTECKPPFDRQQYGGSVGGPIRKDRAWWFFSVENRHQNASVQTGTRDFTRQQVITTSAGAPLRDVLLTGRVDTKLSDNDTLAMRYSFNRSNETANGSLRRPLGTAANRQSSLNRFNSVLGNWTRTISARQVNSLIFHFDRFLNNIPFFAGGNTPTTVPDLGLTNEIRFPSLQDGANFRQPQRTRFDRFQFRDNFVWTVGTHTVHFGGEYQKQFSDALFDLFGSGTLFTTEDFATRDRNGDGAINDRDIPIALVILSGAPVRPPVGPNINNSYVGFYAQDDWRVRSNLTLNYGLRWEFDTDIFGTDDSHGPCPTPLATPPTRPCVWLAGVLGLDRSPDYRDFGPRFGFSWDPFRKAHTVIRGGYGIYYDRVVLEVPLLERLLDGRVLSLRVLGNSTCTAPGRTDRTLDNCALAGARFATGSPTLASPLTGAAASAGIGINILDNRVAHPLVQQWTLGVQHQIARDWIVSADGIHNFGQRFLIGHLLRNSSVSSPLVSCVGNNPCNVTDPLTGRSDNVTNIEPSAKTWYDGLLLSLQKRPTRHGRWGYGFNINYTLSKTFNYANDDQIPFNGAEDQVNIAEGVNNLRLEKGFAPTDERHRFVFFGVFQVPFDISISPIWTIASSVPIDAFVPALTSRLPLLPRNALAREVKNGAQLNAVIQQWNGLRPCPAAFPCRAGGALPTVNPNLEFGDDFNSLDLRVTRAFVFRERHKFELIGEVFNLFNITNIRGFNNNNFSGFSNAITSPDFGRAVSTAGGFFGSGGPRAFQFAVRYSF